jgi:hypothetical protein
LLPSSAKSGNGSSTGLKNHAMHLVIGIKIKEREDTRQVPGQAYWFFIVDKSAAGKTTFGFLKEIP